jgi:glycosyltransferase involved in cell wall biosynthesis
MPEIPDALSSLRVALVHDYLNQPGGAEKVVEVFAEMFPEAPIYTSVYDAEAMPVGWRTRDIRTSFMQKLSPRLSIAKALFPLYPAAFELFDFRNYDLVLSSTTTFAKAVITRPETCHICYCNNPTRFLWMYHDYFEHERFPGPMKAVFPWLVSPLRVWDYAVAQRVDYFIAGSKNAARRISKYYRRHSDVIEPPIDGASFRISDEVDDYFLIVSRLQPYKRIDLAVTACTQLGLPLRIVGDGPDRPRLQRLAGSTISFLGRLDEHEVRHQMSRCKALIFPGEEDFGLTPLEAQASGRPVIAYGAGGALETVKDGETGTYFTTPSAEALAEALSNFDHKKFDPQNLRTHALGFDKGPFKRRMYQVLTTRYDEYRHELTQ